MSFFVRYILPVIAMLAAGFAVLSVVKAQQKPTPPASPIEPGKSPFTRQLAGAGIVEPETENIAIGTHVAGIVDRVFVKVGQTVKTSDPLFQIDDRSLQAELKVRRAVLASAEATLAKLEQAPRREERPAQLARVVEAEVVLKDQEQAYLRMAKVSAGGVSEDELTKRQMSLESAKAQLARAKADFSLWDAGTWGPEKEIAKASVAQSKAQISQTEIELSRLTVMAPRLSTVPSPTEIEFKVLQVNVRPGEAVSAGGNQAAIVLGCVGRLHVRVDLDENDIARFTPDMPGVAKLRGNPDSAFPLTFVRVDPYVIPKRSLTGANTERVDTRVLQVIYRIDTKGQPLYVGQQMDVYLNAK